MMFTKPAPLEIMREKVCEWNCTDERWTQVDSIEMDWPTRRREFYGESAQYHEKWLIRQVRSWYMKPTFNWGFKGVGSGQNGSVNLSFLKVEGPPI